MSLLCLSLPTAVFLVQVLAAKSGNGKDFGSFDKHCSSRLILTAKTTGPSGTFLHEIRVLMLLFLTYFDYSFYF